MPPTLRGVRAAKLSDARALGFGSNLPTRHSSGIFVQSWASLSKLVQIKAQLLLRLPNLWIRASGSLWCGAVRQQTKMIFSRRRSFGISVGQIA